MRYTQKAIYNRRPVVVAMGFDNPLSGYFMTVAPEEGVEDNPDVDEETGMIYSNLDDGHLPRVAKGVPMTADLTYYKRVLREMAIDVPPEFFGKVLGD